MGGWIAFCVLSKLYEIVHCGQTRILLTRFHSFLLLDSTICCRHLTHYSQNVLSDAGQIETHWAASLCGCMCGSARCTSLCVCVCVDACMCIYVCKRWIVRHQGSGAIWCLAWHEKTCLEWDRLPACWGCYMHQRPNFMHFFRVHIRLVKCIYLILHVLISSVTWVAHDTCLVANGQLTALTDSMQPSAPPARWHLWASAALPTSQHTADCKCYQCCQVESIFVSDIGSHCSTNSIMTKNNSGQQWDKSWSASELSTVQRFLRLQPPRLLLQQTARPRLFPYGTSPPCVWYAGV